MGLGEVPMEGLDVNSKFWRGKRVFLTGHTGFKGGWLSLWLQSMGAEVFGYALGPPTNPNLFEIARVGRGMESFHGDIRDLTFLSRTLKSVKPEIIIHMASQPLVRQSYLNPVETYSTNVMGTVNLLEAVRHCSSVRAVLNVTTDKCYENKEWSWGYRENERLGGFDPYSNSKGCSELVTSAYRSSFFKSGEWKKHGVAIATARAGNVVGGGDWAKDRLIPDIIQAFEDRSPIVIRNPSAIRPWQHVLESLSGYLILVQRLYEGGANFAEAWNFGPNADDAKSVEWIVKYLSSALGENVRWIIEEDLNLHEANHLTLDISKAKSRLFWRPKLNIESALDYVVDWVKSRNAGSDMHLVTLRHISEYAASD